LSTGDVYGTNKRAVECVKSILLGTPEAKAINKNDTDTEEWELE